MSLDRGTVVKLGTFSGVAAIYSACHHFGLAELHGLLGASLGVLGAGAHALVGHIGADVATEFADYAAERTARGIENRDLHRLVGETISSILSKESKRQTADKNGALYLKRASEAFLGASWMEAKLSAGAAAIGEPRIDEFFTGRAEIAKGTPTLELPEWEALVQQVAGEATLSPALGYAARALHQDFAFGLWQTAKHAWKQGGLAWPALNLRLLSLIVGHLEKTTADTSSLQREVGALRDAIMLCAAASADSPSPENQILLVAIRESNDRLNTQIGALTVELREWHSSHDQRLANLEAISTPGTAPWTSEAGSVFVSYAPADADFVSSEIIPALHGAGFRTPDFRTSNSVHRKTLPEGIAKVGSYDWMLVVLSPSAIESASIREELALALDHQPASVIAVMHQECEVQSLLGENLLAPLADYTRSAREGRRKMLSLLEGKRESIPVKVNVTVLRGRGRALRTLDLQAKDTLPLRVGDHIRIEVRLSQPAYIYVVWISGDGKVQPLYPWEGGDWNRSIGPHETDHVILPDDRRTLGWPVEGPPGVDSLIVLVRHDRLESSFNLRQYLLNLPVIESISIDQELIAFLHEPKRSDELPKRGLAVDRVEDAGMTIDLHTELIDRLARHFSVIHGMSFGCRA